MSSTNAFLKDFIQMRKSIQEQSRTPIVTPDLSNTKNKKATTKAETTTKKTKSNISDVQQINDAKHEEEEEESPLQKIINQKLPKRDVICFLQEFANQMTIKKMA